MVRGWTHSPSTQLAWSPLFPRPQHSLMHRFPSPSSPKHTPADAPHSPRGEKRKNDSETSPDEAKYRKVENTGNEPTRLQSTDEAQALTPLPQAAFDGDRAWRLLDVATIQRIACLLASPTHLTFADQPKQGLSTALAIAKELVHWARSNGELRRMLAPLLRMARWSVELALLHKETTTNAPIDFLLSNPMAPFEGDPGLRYPLPEYADLSSDQIHGVRLDALLQAVAEHTQRESMQHPGRIEPQRHRTRQAKALLSRLFEAWCARLQKDVNASLHLPHLPLDDLPVRLFRSVSHSDDHTLDSVWLRRAIGRGFVCPPAPTSQPAQLLLKHLKDMDNDLKLFIWAHLHQLLDSEDPERQFWVSQVLENEGMAEDEVIPKVQRWTTGFLFVDSEAEIQESVAREVWEWIDRAPLLGAPVPLQMINKFCRSPSLDHIASDEQLNRLLHRALVELAGMPPTVAQNRVEYFVMYIPQTFGLVAFTQLTQAERVRLIDLVCDALSDERQPYKDIVDAEAERPLQGTTPGTVHPGP